MYQWARSVLFMPSGFMQARRFYSGSNRALIQDKYALRKHLHQLGVYLPGKYLHDQFTHWLSKYANECHSSLDAYFANQTSLNSLCQNFIQFCFKHNIALDKEKTLKSFEEHDAISDSAIKRELTAFQPKQEVNILGFGLGNGDYEKNIAKYLVENKLAESAKIYGFDPYAEKSDKIELLTENQLVFNQTPVFDIITARWVLHHVCFKERWVNFVNCANRSTGGAMIFIIEHGFLQKDPLSSDKKLNALLNATFDAVANIGIRPLWFTNTAPDIGTNFFIHYLEDRDFEDIKKGIKIQTTQKIYNVGPAFPNQTICYMRIKP